LSHRRICQVRGLNRPLSNAPQDAVPRVYPDQGREHLLVERWALTGVVAVVELAGGSFEKALASAQFSLCPPLSHAQHDLGPYQQTSPIHDKGTCRARWLDLAALVSAKQFGFARLPLTYTGQVVYPVAENVSPARSGSPTWRLRCEYLRHKTNHKAGGAADSRTHSLVACTHWLAALPLPCRKTSTTGSLNIRSVQVIHLPTDQASHK